MTEDTREYVIEQLLLLDAAGEEIHDAPSTLHRVSGLSPIDAVRDFVQRVGGRVLGRPHVEEDMVRVVAEVKGEVYRLTVWRT